MENRKVLSLSIPRFLCSPILLLGRTHKARPIVHCPQIYHLASGHVVQSVYVASIKDIWQITCEIWDGPRRSRWKFSRKLDATSRFESFFSLSHKRQRSAGNIAHPYTYTGAPVFDRHQTFCESAARWTGWQTYVSAETGWKDKPSPKWKPLCVDLTRVQLSGRSTEKCSHRSIPISFVHRFYLSLGPRKQG